MIIAIASLCIVVIERVFHNDFCRIQMHAMVRVSDGLINITKVLHKQREAVARQCAGM